MSINDNGATPNINAILDVDVTTNDKGILIPRISSGQRTGIMGLGVSDEGLTVYDETTKSYWLWDGSQWIQFAMLGKVWEQSGNGGTSPGTDFIGTTDAQDLVVKTNNIEQLRIDALGRVGIGTDSPSADLDVDGSLRIRGGSPSIGSVLMASNTDGTTTWSSSGYGLVPIGSIIAWHGDLTGVPPLPDGWVECDGSTIVDAASPMVGQIVPDLNGPNTASGSGATRGRFLRGHTTSGLFEADRTNNLYRWEQDDSDGGPNQYESNLPQNGNWAGFMGSYHSTDRRRFRLRGGETNPLNMSVRWIMRIK